MTKAWDDHKEVIIGEYKDNNKPLHEVQRIMEERFRFKASTRAYRSRLDKWGVYKYSCRKRNGSSSTNEDGSPDEDTPVLSPPATPGPQHTSPMTDPECPRTPGTMSPISSLPPQNHHPYFSGNFCGTTSPSGLGSPLSAPMKFDQPQQPQYHQPIRHTMSLPNPGQISDSQFRPYYSHHHHHHHQQQQQQQHFGPPIEYYRQNTQGHGYHQFQDPVNTSVSLPSSPIPDRFSQLHHANHGWLNADAIKSPPE